MERRAWGQPRPREPLGRSGGLCSACAVRILRRFFAELGWIASRRGVATSLAGLSRARAPVRPAVDAADAGSFLRTCSRRGPGAPRAPGSASRDTERTMF